MLSRQIERAQRKVEAHNFDIRKQLLEYDDVANDQRKVVYQQRQELMEAEDISDAIRAIRGEVVNTVSRRARPAARASRRSWDKEGLGKALEREFGVRFDAARAARAGSHDRREGAAPPDRRRASTGTTRRKPPSSARSSCTSSRRASCCGSSTRTGRSTSARSTTCARAFTCAATRRSNPKQEYKREAFEMFSSMLDRVKHDTIAILSQDPDPQARGRPGASSPRRPIRARSSSSTRAAPSITPPRPPAAGAGGRAAATAAAQAVPQPAAGADRAVCARAAEGRAQRAVSVRLGQEIQAVPRPPQLTR